MLEPFPTLSDYSKLTVDDFYRFSGSFAELMQKPLPAAKSVTFAFSAGQVEMDFRKNGCAAELLSLFIQVKEGVVAFGIHDDYLMLSFNVKGGERIVAIVSGADHLFLQRVSEDWLLEIRETVERDFLLLKQARVDSQTGLLNVSNLFSLLDTYSSTKDLRLVLLELTPKRNSLQYSMKYLRKCSNHLANFVQKDSLLHYLGQSTFAFVIQQSSQGELPEIERALVSYLKRVGCHRVHIGSSFSRVQHESENHRGPGRQLLDEAWTALRHAAKRGPFSFCDFGQLAHPEKHPLAPPDRNLVRRLHRLWSQSDSFSLVQFCSDSGAYSANSVVLPHIHQGVVLSSGDDVFVYLDGVKAEKALKWAEEVIRLSCDSAQNIHVSAGVSRYPYCDFKKSEMVFNCRKALLHAAFFGNSSTAVFDALTLNISGDIYFGDGDLAKAVAEYQRGIKCDKHDVNLHNSLGVALAMMNKLPAALQSFDQALTLDGHNFMALYNLGLGEQTRNRKAEALVYLEKALQYYSNEEGGAELVGDLTLQLGILSCETGKYEAALSYLIPWQGANKSGPNSGRVHYFLGEAYHGLKNNRKAMEELQRALRFDELDDRAMSLLGRTYLEEGEGNEIALSLCRKSVELEPTNLRYMLYLAEVLLQCGSTTEARGHLYRCLKNRDYKMDAQLLLGESYARDGQLRRAKIWFEKVLEQKKCPQDLKGKAEKEMGKIISITKR